jgi:ATP-dependent RNA helicase DHX8/PRP22
LDHSSLNPQRVQVAITYNPFYLALLKFFLLLGLGYLSDRNAFTQENSLCIAQFAKMDAIQKLQRLSLVQKVVKELDTNLGMGNMTLAEFVINLAEQSADQASFAASLKANGADFPGDFIVTLHKLIEKMNPKKLILGGAGLVKKESDPVVVKKDDPAIETKPLLPVSTDSNRKRDYEGDNDRGYDAPPKRIKTEEDGARGGGHKYGEEDRRRDSEFSRRDERRYDDGYDRRDDRRDDRRYDRRNVDEYGRESRREDSYSRDGRSSRESDRGDSDRHRSSDLDDAPVLNKIYDGMVSNIRDFGCFVSIQGVKGQPEGMVHISEVRADRVNNIADVVHRKQRVKVKVKSVAAGKVSLTMKEVDQATGEDLLPQHDLEDYSSRRGAEDEFSSGRLYERAPRDTSMLGSERINRAMNERGPTRAQHRVSSPDRFEWEQMMRSGKVKLEDTPQFDRTRGSLLEVDDVKDRVDRDVELNDEQPIFLRGHMAHAYQLSPVKIVANPTGSMQRAAITQGTLSKERREIRDQQRNSLLDSMDPSEMSIMKADPMAQASEKQALIETLNKQAQSDVPEWKKNAFGQGIKLGQHSSKTILEQRQSLPIFLVRDQLLKAVLDYNILIVVGETGSGKTTQLTQYLAEAGYTSKGRIGCTQPRRVAATSVAKRVAEEVGCHLGEQVGYSIRFEDMTSADTKIKYMTDGMLLRECLIDPDLKQYSCIILDEAHERSIHTDVLMGLLKQTAQRRPDLRLIVTSATLNAEKFSSYFFGAPIFTVKGRTFPVEVLWTREPEEDYLDAALLTVLQIHINEPAGDILVFLTGQEEIDTACQILYERIKNLGPDLPELVILPIYSALPSEMQSRIFDAATPGSRKVIIGTNIAETSVTIDGIYYVVDPGFVKQKVYNPKTGMDALVVTPVSKAQAEQRKGRAGRTGPGKCYRLYTQTAFETEMLDSPIPELQRTNLASTVLTMKALGIDDLINFDFMDKPAEAQLVSAMHTLYTLGALDDEGTLTRIGRKMAELPLEPQLAKMLLISVELRCSEEILSIVAMLNVQNVFYRPKEKAQLADQKRSKFTQPEGDHITLLTVWEGWKASRFSNPWCFENFIQARSMKRAQDVRKQLLAMMDRYKLDIVSCGKNYTLVRKAIVAGFFTNAAKKDPQEGYKTIVESTPVYIHPSSSVFQRNPEWVIYHELVQTTKEYMREVTVIEPAWLVEFAPKFFKAADPHAISHRKRKERLEPLYNKYRDPNEWRISRRKG